MWMMLTALMMTAPASAEDCVWGDEIKSVYATMTTVSINGKQYTVKGSAARAQFISQMSECGVPGHVIASFQEWRSMRRWTNITGGVGACCFYPLLLATPVTAVLAGDAKDNFLMQLQQLDS